MTGRWSMRAILPITAGKSAFGNSRINSWKLHVFGRSLPARAGGRRHCYFSRIPCRASPATPRPAADIVLTPKPDHGPDGKLVNLCWSQPAELVPRLFKELGPFPLMNYWGPMAGIASSQWIAQAAAIVWREHNPQLQWVYIPHLDYDMQRFGPNSPQAKAAVRDAAAAIEPLVVEVMASGGRKIVLLSEYAMREVNSFLQPNLILQQEGLLTTRQIGRWRLDGFRSILRVRDGGSPDRPCLCQSGRSEIDIFARTSK